MAPELILICQSGGTFVQKKDGSLSYSGGEAHAVDVTRDTRFDDFKLELSHMWDCDMKTMSIKYFLPSNRRTLITLSNDKDLQRMIDFHGSSATADVYVVEKECVAHNVSKMPTDRTHMLIKAESKNNITTAGTSLGDASITQNVDLAPFSVAPDRTGTVLDSSMAIPIADTSISYIPVSAPAADSSAPTAGPSTTGIAANPAFTTLSPPDDVTLDDVGKKRWTASWKMGVNGFTIGSISDHAGKRLCTGSQEDDINCPDAAFSADNAGQQVGTASSGNETNSHPTVSVDSVQQKLIESWKNGITSVGQDFSSAHEFREMLRKYAIANHFVYKLKKNDTDRVSAICKDDECPWRIHASWVPTVKSLRIKKLHNSHTCGKISLSAHHQTTKHWLASLVKEKLRDTPHYKPKEIVSDICKDFGIELKYSQAYRGIEEAREQLQGSYKEAYNQLPLLCEKVVEVNPSSVARLTTKDDLSFQRLFLTFHASSRGFRNGCRPLIFLDTTPLRSKYLETLLLATAVDGDDGAFPVAFAIVDVENDDNWHWFLEELKSVVTTSRSITFVSDKQKGLSEAVHDVFENAQHGFCIHQLVDNFKKSLKGPFQGDGKNSLAGNFLSAARAVRLDEFRKYTESIKKVSIAAYDWVMESEPEHWANSQFKGEQYNQITFESAQTFDKWVSDVRELPITQKIEVIICKTMELINSRRKDSSKWTTKLTPFNEVKLQQESKKARSVKVLISSDSIFEVHDEFINVVNIDQRECSCQRWTRSGLPCGHAIAVFNITSRNLYDYCSKYFTTEAFQLTYSESIKPIPEIEKPENKEASEKPENKESSVKPENEEACENPEDKEALEKALVCPPHARTHHGGPGQPKKLRTKCQEEVKRPLHCSLCNRSGHNRATCKGTK